MVNISVSGTSEVARPLAVLVPLIKKDLEEAHQAGMPYYRAAGEKLLEARDGSFEGKLTEFYIWAERNFGKSKVTIRTYMSLVLAETNYRRQFTSLQEHKSHQTGVDQSPRMRPRAWQESVKEDYQRAIAEARQLMLQESLTRKQEREAERTLALRLINIGYKVLAKELHPDKGGTRETMQRLSRVRDRLKEAI